MSEQIHNITLTNDIEEVQRMTDFVNGVCNDHSVDDMLAMQINLAIEEAVVNVIKYAYPTGTKGDILLTCIAKGDSLQFVLADKGKPFDPTKQPPADTSLPAEQRQIGGLGIFLVKQIMDEVSYERKDDTNVLTMTKKYTI